MACVVVRQLRSQCFLYLALISLLSSKASKALNTLPTSQPEYCPNSCGDIVIPYPFGTRPGCYREGFEIMCNESTTPAKAFLGSTSLPLIGINLTSGESRVYKDIDYRCYNQSNQIYDYYTEHVSRSLDYPYLFSHKRNKFTVVGCDASAAIMSIITNFQLACGTSCLSSNSSLDNNGSCDGLGCCQTAIPSRVKSYLIDWFYNINPAWQFSPCTFAFLVQEDWYRFQSEDLSGKTLKQIKTVPVVLDWAIRANGTSCQNGVEKSPNPFCISEHSTCHNTSNGDGYLCSCSQGYEGNPYIIGGCIDIDECKFPSIYPCKGICINKEGSYNCPCKKGAKGDGKDGNCTENFPYPARVAIFSIVGVIAPMGICLLVVAYQRHKRHIKKNEEYQRYYQMMDNKLRLFSKRQIKIATNNFAETHVLGVGGQGKVYKGYLEDNQNVAIKKSKEFDCDHRADFVNEILLLSQINHKNIVRLLGCCMEVKIPILVYEFISNGTLHDLLHGTSRSRSVSLGLRLNIALELAESLDYLHSSISRSILHGDVKSANILLDENYHVKVSDFGASDLVPIDDTQVVKVVQGTRGYIDPEYVATGILTKKSDVYSFGVVLLELITRKCAIFEDETNERKHLASCFVSNASKNLLHDLLDKDIAATGEKVIIDVLQEISNLAVGCLSVKGDDRPTMKQVVEKLQNVARLDSSLLGPHTGHEETGSLQTA